MTNRYGDIELDARGMRALAHPVRIALLTLLQGHGPSTATRLAPGVGASPSVTSWHLRHLAEHGLVRDAEVGADVRGHSRERWWEATARGFRFGSGEANGESDEGHDEAARRLSRLIEESEGDIVGRWFEEMEPLLEPEWRRLSGRANTTILATPAELRQIEDAVEALLAPYVLRKDADPSAVPSQARRVRMLRHVLPERATTSTQEGRAP